MLNLKVNEMTGVEFEKCASFPLDVKKGLLANQKRISSKYLYDTRGSELFVDIMKLKEYYVSNCEEEIFVEQADNIVSKLASHITEVVELGCGDGQKTKILLKAIERKFQKIRYVPVDISSHSVDVITRNIHADLPDIRVNGYVGDYFQYLNSHFLNGPTESRLILFLGSNIGNFNRAEMIEFLSAIRDSMNYNDYLLVGFDLKKDIQVMHKAYNDSQGVTAEFNFNLLNRINEELGGTFERDMFYHHGVYNPETGAMQSFLISKAEQKVEIKDLGIVVSFDRLEPIHIENSHKFTLKEVRTLAEDTGFDLIRNFIDSKDYFVDSLWQK